jgi:hypothetical protein
LEAILITALAIGVCLASSFMLLSINVVLTDRRRTHHTSDIRVPRCAICRHHYSHERS